MNCIGDKYPYRRCMNHRETGADPGPCRRPAAMTNQSGTSQVYVSIRAPACGWICLLAWFPLEGQAHDKTGTFPRDRVDIDGTFVLFGDYEI
jgi:hypothetical protein